MPFNGSGVFLRVRNWVNDATANIRIRADRHDSEDDNFANGLSQCITKDGQTTITGNLPMAGYRHTGVGDAQLNTQYARYDQVSAGKTNWAIASGTGDAVVVDNDIATPSLQNGQETNFRVTTANATTTPTLNVDGHGAKTILAESGNALSIGDLVVNSEVTVRYNQALDSYVVVGKRISIPNGFITSAMLQNNINLNGIPTAATAAVGTTGAQLATLDFAIQNNWQNGAVIPLTSGSTVTLASSIPSWAKVVIISLNRVSTNGTVQPLIQLNGETSGYQGDAARMADSAAPTANQPTNGIGISSATASANLTGNITLVKTDAASNTWVASGTISNGVSGSAAGGITATVKSLSAPLSSIVFTVGVNAFDGAGSATVSWS